jgi:hypothetical protein
MIAAIAFAVAGYSFRDTSTMASIFSPIEHEILPVSNPFSARIGADKTTVASKQIFLLMVDSTAQFENVVKDFAVEQISNRIPVFLFSSKANPVYRVLSGMEGARFYTTSDVSYPKPTDQPYEILVPQNDQAVLIDVIRKTVSAAPEAAIIYDNISDILVSWGTGEAYKFLKAAREVLEHQVSGLFILTEGAHDQNSVNIIKTLFENHLHYGKDGLKVLKQLEPIAAV